MKTRLLLACTTVALVLLGLAGCADGAPEVVGTTPPTPSVESTPAALDDVSIALEPVADGFGQPLYVTGAGDGSDRLFVVEKTGRIWIVRDGETLATPFLDLSARVSTESEQGLLGLAFSPSFADDGLFWVDFTDENGATVLASFAANGDRADPASEQTWLSFGQPYKNHNGGMIAFGPDGHLYVATGDGGSGGDPEGNGQDPGTLLGKLLRLNVLFDASETRETVYGIPDDNPFVGQDGARSEIWALGLRNPWRFSFDRETGDLWIGDVGQNAWEEIDFQPASSSGGENYGWNVYEGSHPYPADSTPPEGDFAAPVIEYDRATGTSVTGGYVYRGPERSLTGIYFYADFSVGRVWGARRAPDGAVETRELLDTDMNIASFGEGDDGSLYVVDLNGSVHRLVAK